MSTIFTFQRRAAHRFARARGVKEKAALRRGRARRRNEFCGENAADIRRQKSGQANRVSQAKIKNDRKNGGLNVFIFSRWLFNVQFLLAFFSFHKRQASKFL